MRPGLLCGTAATHRQIRFPVAAVFEGRIVWRVAKRVERRNNRRAAGPSRFNSGLMAETRPERVGRCVLWPCRGPWSGWMTSGWGGRMAEEIDRERLTRATSPYRFNIPE